MEYAPKKTKIKFVNGGRYGMTNDGYFTNTDWAFIVDEKCRHENPAIYNHVSNEYPSIMNILGNLDNYKQVGYRYVSQLYLKASKKHYDVVIVGPEGDDSGSAVINREYLDVLLTYHPKALPHVMDGLHAAVFKNNVGEVVGVIMPISMPIEGV